MKQAASKEEDTHRGEELPQLHRAAFTQDVPWVKSLLSKPSSSINETDSHGRTALHYACLSGCYDAAGEILNRSNPIDIEARDSKGQTPIFLAVESDALNCVQLLTYHGAKVDVKDNSGTPLLHYAIRRKNSNIVKHLVVQGSANITTSDKNGFSVLHVAAAHGYADMTEMLISLGADIDQVDCKNRTPLMAAVAGGFEKIVQTLLNNNADLPGVDSQHMTAVDWAQKGQNNRIQQLLYEAEVKRKFLTFFQVEKVEKNKPSSKTNQKQPKVGRGGVLAAQRQRWGLEGVLSRSSYRGGLDGATRSQNYKNPDEGTLPANNDNKPDDMKNNDSVTSNLSSPPEITMTVYSENEAGDGFQYHVNLMDAEHYSDSGEYLIKDSKYLSKQSAEFFVPQDSSEPRGTSAQSQSTSMGHLWVSDSEGHESNYEMTSSRMKFAALDQSSSNSDFDNEYVVPSNINLEISRDGEASYFFMDTEEHLKADPSQMTKEELGRYSQAKIERLKDKNQKLVMDVAHSVQDAFIMECRADELEDKLKKTIDRVQQERYKVKGLIKRNAELEKKIKLLTEEKNQSNEELKKQKYLINEKEEQVVYLRTRLDAFEEATAGTLTSDSSSEETLMKKIEMLRNANIKLVKDLEEERKNRSELQEVTTKLAQVKEECAKLEEELQVKKQEVAKEHSKVEEQERSLEASRKYYEEKLIKINKERVAKLKEITKIKESFTKLNRELENVKSDRLDTSKKGSSALAFSESASKDKESQAKKQSITGEEDLTLQIGLLEEQLKEDQGVQSVGQTDSTKKDGTSEFPGNRKRLLADVAKKQEKINAQEIEMEVLKSQMMILEIRLQENKDRQSVMSKQIHHRKLGEELKQKFLLKGEELEKELIKLKVDLKYEKEKRRRLSISEEIKERFVSTSEKLQQELALMKVTKEVLTEEKRKLIADLKAKDLKINEYEKYQKQVSEQQNTIEILQNGISDARQKQSKFMKLYATVKHKAELYDELVGSNLQLEQKIVNMEKNLRESESRDTGIQCDCVAKEILSESFKRGVVKFLKDVQDVRLTLEKEDSTLSVKDTASADSYDRLHAKVSKHQSKLADVHLMLGSIIDNGKRALTELNMKVTIDAGKPQTEANKSSNINEPCIKEVRFSSDVEVITKTETLPNTELKSDLGAGNKITAEHAENKAETKADTSEHDSEHSKLVRELWQARLTLDKLQAENKALRDEQKNLSAKVDAYKEFAAKYCQNNDDMISLEEVLEENAKLMEENAEMTEKYKAKAKQLEDLKAKSGGFESGCIVKEVSSGKMKVVDDLVQIESGTSDSSIKSSKPENQSLKVANDKDCSSAKEGSFGQAKVTDDLAQEESGTEKQSPKATSGNNTDCSSKKECLLEQPNVVDDLVQIESCAPESGTDGTLKAKCGDGKVCSSCKGATEQATVCGCFNMKRNNSINKKYQNLKQKTDNWTKQLQQEIKKLNTMLDDVSKQNLELKKKYDQLKVVMKGSDIAQRELEAKLETSVKENSLLKCELDGKTAAMEAVKEESVNASEELLKTRSELEANVNQNKNILEDVRKQAELCVMLEEEKRRFEDELMIAQLEITKLTEDRKVLHDKFQAAKSEAEQRKTKCKSSIQEIETNANRCVVLSDEKRKVEEKLLIAEREVVKLKEDYKMLQQQFDKATEVGQNNLQESMQESKALADRFASISEGRDQLEERLLTAQQEMVKMKEDCKLLQMQYESAQDEIKQKQNHCIKAKDEIKASNDRYEALSDEKCKIEEGLNIAQQEMAAMKKRCEVLQMKYESVQDEIKQKENESKKAKDEIKGSDDRYTTLLDEKSKLEEELTISQQEMTKLKENYDLLQIQYESAADEIKQKRNECKKAKEDIKDSNDRYEALSGEKSKLQERLMLAQQEMAKLKEDCKLLHITLDSARDEIKQQKNECKKAKEDIKDSNDRYEALSGEKCKLQRKSDTVEQQLARKEEEHETLRRQHQTAISNSELNQKELLNSKQETQTYADRYLALSKEKQKLEEQIDNVQLKLANLQEDHEMLQENYEALKADAELSKNEAANNTKLTEKYLRRCSALTEEKCQMEEELNVVQKQLDNLKEDHQNLQAKLDAARTDAEINKRELIEKSRSVEDLRVSLKDACNQNTQQGDENLKLQAEVDMLAEKNKQIQQENEDLSIKNNKVRMELELVRPQAERASQLENELHDMKMRLEHLRRECDELMKLYQAKSADLEIYQSSNEGLQDEVRAANNKIEKLVRNIERNEKLMEEERNQHNLLLEEKSEVIQRLAESNRKLERFSRNYVDMKQRYLSTKSEVEDLKEVAANHKELKAKYESKLKELDDLVEVNSEINRRQFVVEEELDEEQKKNTELIEEITEIENKKIEALAEISRLSIELSECKERIKVLQDNKTQMKAEIVARNGSMALMHQRLIMEKHGLEEKLTENFQESEQMKKEITKLNRVIDEREEENIGLQSRSNALKTENKDLRQQIILEKAYAQKNRSEQTDLHSGISSRENNILVLSSKVKNLQNENAQLNEDLMRCLRDNDRFSRNLTFAQYRLGMVNDRNEELWNQYRESRREYKDLEWTKTKNEIFQLAKEGEKRKPATSLDETIDGGIAKAAPENGTDFNMADGIPAIYNYSIQAARIDALLRMPECYHEK